MRICQWLKSPWGCTWTCRKRSPPTKSAHKRSSLPPDQMQIVQLPWLDLPRFNRSLFKEVICFTCVMSFIFKKTQQNKKNPYFPLFYTIVHPKKMFNFIYILQSRLSPDTLQKPRAWHPSKNKWQGKTFFLTVGNLEQDQAHIGGPSCWWLAKWKGGRVEGEDKT